MKKVITIFAIIIILLATFAFGGYFVMLKQNIIVSNNYIVAEILGFYSVYNMQTMDESVVENVEEDKDTNVLIVEVPAKEEEELYIVQDSANNETISSDIDE